VVYGGGERGEGGGYGTENREGTARDVSGLTVCEEPSERGAKRQARGF